MIYILTAGDYSDYAVENVLDLPAPLTKDDAAAFEAWLREQAEARTRDGELMAVHSSKRVPLLRRWLVEHRGATVAVFGEVCSNDYGGDLTTIKNPPEAGS